MDNSIYLFAGNVAIWLAVGGYVAFLAARTSGVNRRIGQLERLREGDDE